MNLKVKNKFLNNAFDYVLKMKEKEMQLTLTLRLGRNHNSISTYMNCFILACLLVILRVFKSS